MLFTYVVLIPPQRRFEDALKKLSADLEMKLTQREAMKEKQRMRKEGITLDQDHDSDIEGTQNAIVPGNGVPMDID